MKVAVKINGLLLDQVRRDLARPHFFAHERVGFLTAGAAASPDGLMLLVRGYIPVGDEDYEVAPNVGARIGSNAMRKAAQAAYRPASTLLHVHTHGGRGYPRFSGVDLESARTFVPGFFQSCPKMPHGLLVLSNDAATGILWLDPRKRPIPIDRFIRIDQPIVEQWRAQYELA
ncbi:hypothetical protein [Rhizobium indigoferae]|jgi:hypothetical protein|uniref:JAB domain-containing protein n=1 Tax=Rhizobium indigoferae TaxID=158891 RepID=A0ABZ1DT77_9HYPH|nr:hypothetical protein [Rhizobium indigoferae]NNU55582.1 hypothetical protein [Rhizobium indigoferae]WRW39432.1 hypothetical protein U5G49_006508 [Rhizobium indigoferae]GLR56821.1 hypothetical protein GCM10007919_15450 [Rhizobium indigoferae]